MQMEQIGTLIAAGEAVLGIELGSTRIKAVLIGEDHAPIASGAHDWENQLVNGLWTYRLADVWTGVQDAYAQLAGEVFEKYGTRLTRVKAIGFSAMMHGYLPFDQSGKQLAEFRTWRNTTTEQAAQALTELFGFNIPQRWSIAHLEQAMLNAEPHVAEIGFLTTLAGYIHWQLTGQKVLGVGEASGMFPIGEGVLDYDAGMMRKYDERIASKGFTWKLRDILPRVLAAGEPAGTLTEAGAKLLDPTGTMLPGIPLCPPEGDAGTGMVATNSVAVRTGNVSAGTSVFAMIVLEKALSRVYPEIDMVTTPTGKPVAMVHCNNCTSDINAWADVLRGFLSSAKLTISANELYGALFRAALEGDSDCGGVVNYNYLSGEPITGLETGRPMVVRTPDAKMTFANFARSLVFGAVVTLKIGMRILEHENVRVDSLLGHGGFFKTKPVGQKVLAAALNTPVSVMETAGEGGPWGMALLAAFMANRTAEQTLEQYLTQRVFALAKSECVTPDAADVEGFEAYTRRFENGLGAERAAASELF